MAKVILITGGSRSGKSIYAQKIAESISCTRTYIATCPYLDEEMTARIRKHRAARGSSCWQTIEETIDIAGVLRRSKESQVILLDCLTLWINNILYEAERRGESLDEEAIGTRCREVLDVCAGIPGMVIFVTNEVGMGIVPESPASRLYRDIAGRCNQIIASHADVVVFMISGLPLYIKGEKVE